MPQVGPVISDSLSLDIGGPICFPLILLFLFLSPSLQYIYRLFSAPSLQPAGFSFPILVRGTPSVFATLSSTQLCENYTGVSSKPLSLSFLFFCEPPPLLLIDRAESMSRSAVLIGVSFFFCAPVSLSNILFVKEVPVSDELYPYFCRASSFFFLFSVICRRSRATCFYSTIAVLHL